MGDFHWSRDAKERDEFMVDVDGFFKKIFLQPNKQGIKIVYVEW